MEKTKINNTHYIILGALGTAFAFCFLLALFFIVKSYVKEAELSKFGSAGDFFNGFITPFVSIISAILIYIAFKQQVDANKEQEIRFNKQIAIDKADKDFDRCMKLIDEIEKYQKKLVLTKVNKHTFLSDESIMIYTYWLTMNDNEKKSYQYIIDYERDLFIYFANVEFTLSNIQKLIITNEDYFHMLYKKLIFAVPNIYMQVTELVKLEKEVTYDKQSNDGIKLYSSIKALNDFFEEYFKYEEALKIID